MKTKVTVAVITRGQDSLLNATIENIMRTTQRIKPEMLVVIDGETDAPTIPYKSVNQCFTDNIARGTSFARHTAMMQAEGEIVITCDSHMSFPEGWLEKYIEHLTLFPKHIVCSRTAMLDKNGAGSVYSGAEFTQKIIGSPDNKNACRLEGERQPFGGGWRKVDYDGPIQCVMGGCYGLTKSFYLKMGRPWRFGAGWGMDEEAISLMSWYKGGLCWLLPQTITHHGGTRGFKEDGLLILKVHFNRRRIVEMIDDKLTRNDLLDWYGKTMSTVDEDFIPIQTFRNTEILPTAFGYGFVDLIDDFESRVTVRNLKQVMKQRGMKGYQTLPKTTLLEMWKANPVIKTEPKKKQPEKPKPRNHKANYGAFENRRTCFKCSSAKSRVDHTKTTGRLTIRNRICLDCGARRVTQEIVPID